MKKLLSKLLKPLVEGLVAERVKALEKEFDLWMAQEHSTRELFMDRVARHNQIIEAYCLGFTKVLEEKL